MTGFSEEIIYMLTDMTSVQLNLKWYAFCHLHGILIMLPCFKEESGMPSYENHKGSSGANLIKSVI